ncbi:MAG: S8 family serine peptidase [Proteobacteria bacterium]|nr:S8 family serine peptidase [Pseudomonadota bacterium]
MKTTHLVHAGVALALAFASQSAITAPRPGGPPAATSALRAAAATDSVEFSVRLPLRHPQQLDALVADLHDSKSPNYQKWLTPEQFRQRFSPTVADLESARSALVSHGFTIVRSDAHGMRVRGPAASVANAFRVGLDKRTVNGHQHFVARGTPQLPSELAALNAQVIGLERLPEHRPHMRVTGHVAEMSVDNRYGPTGPYWFDDLKQAYDYPAYSHKVDGTGVNVAVLMADLIFPDDVPAAFNHEKFTDITGLPAPSVTTVLVDGGGVENGGGSFEASLDVQQVLGGAPGANVTLVSIPDLSDAHIMDGYTYIVDNNTYDIVNSSFGGCELEYTAAYNGGTDYTYILQQYHEIFAQGNAQGITFVASSGDQGGLICPTPDYGTPGASPTFVPGVSTPASDPAVTAVGGGNLITVNTAGSLDSTYVRESAFADPEVPYDPFGLGQDVSGGVWGAGGGISSVFGKPLYQYLANTGSNHWRTVPDVGMQVGGCPLGLASSCGNDDSAAVVAYGVGLGGGYYGVIGTSVSSPEFVGALALFEQQLGKRHRIGNANYFIYARAALQTLTGGVDAPEPLQFFHRGIPGNDGYWNGGQPSANYDYIYGNGSPDVRKLFGLRRFKPAGLPRTPGNP